MSRCRCCNEILDFEESHRSYAVTGDDGDMCDNCLEPVKDDIDTISGDDSFLDYGYDYEPEGGGYGAEDED